MKVTLKSLFISLILKRPLIKMNRVPTSKRKERKG